MNLSATPLTARLGLEETTSDRGDDLLERHNTYFYTKAADTVELRELGHALRYQVYCLERQFEDPRAHHQGLEIDAFDGHAVHGLLFHRPSNVAIGTVRMIMPDGATGQPLPVHNLLTKSGTDLSDFVDVSRCVEVSRFAISKEFRRRQCDKPDEPGTLNRREFARQGNLACLGLIQFLVRQSTQRNILYWAAVMEPKLLRMLATLGIHFTAIGSLVMHHGLRQPCYCHVPTMLKNVAHEHPGYWQVLTHAGGFTLP